MKYQILGCFFWLFGICQLNAGIETNSDSTNFIHIFKKNGPISIQIIWLDNDTGQAFVEKGIWLKAALEGGTMRYNTADFKALSIDYRIKWKVESAHGMHRLGTTFAQMKFNLVMAMLDQILNETRYLAKDLILWRKNEIYHYNYYKNDPDSLIKWWINGQELYFKTLAETPLENSNGPLITILGKPQIVSSIGRVNELLIKQGFFRIMKTKHIEWNNHTLVAKDWERVRLSSFVYSGIKIWNSNPLWTDYTLMKIALITDESIVSKVFNINKNMGYLCYAKGYLFEMDSQKIEEKNDEYLKEQTLINYYTWLEFNAHEALANAYINLGIWEEDMVLNFRDNLKLENETIIAKYFLKRK